MLKTTNPGLEDISPNPSKLIEPEILVPSMDKRDSGTFRRQTKPRTVSILRSSYGFENDPPTLSGKPSCAIKSTLDMLSSKPLILTSESIASKSCMSSTVPCSSNDSRNDVHTSNPIVLDGSVAFTPDSDAFNISDLSNFSVTTCSLANIVSPNESYSSSKQLSDFSAKCVVDGNQSVYKFPSHFASVSEAKHSSSGSDNLLERNACFPVTNSASDRYAVSEDLNIMRLQDKDLRTSEQDKSPRTSEQDKNLSIFVSNCMDVFSSSVDNSLAPIHINPTFTKDMNAPSEKKSNHPIDLNAADNLSANIKMPENELKEKMSNKKPDKSLLKHSSKSFVKVPICENPSVVTSESINKDNSSSNIILLRDDCNLLSSVNGGFVLNSVPYTLRQPEINSKMSGLNPGILFSPQPSLITSSFQTPVNHVQSVGVAKNVTIPIGSGKDKNDVSFHLPDSSQGLSESSMPAVHLSNVSYSLPGPPQSISHISIPKIKNGLTGSKMNYCSDSSLILMSGMNETQTTVSSVSQASPPSSMTSPSQSIASTSTLNVQNGVNGPKLFDFDSNETLLILFSEPGVSSVGKESHLSSFSCHSQTTASTLSPKIQKGPKLTNCSDSSLILMSGTNGEQTAVSSVLKVSQPSSLSGPFQCVASMPSSKTENGMNDSKLFDCNDTLLILVSEPDEKQPVVSSVLKDSDQSSMSIPFQSPASTSSPKTQNGVNGPKLTNCTDSSLILSQVSGRNEKQTQKLVKLEPTSLCFPLKQEKSFDVISQLPISVNEGISDNSQSFLKSPTSSIDLATSNSIFADSSSSNYSESDAIDNKNHAFKQTVCSIAGASDAHANQKNLANDYCVSETSENLPAISDLISPLYKYIKDNKCLLCGFESKAKEPYVGRRHLITHLHTKNFKCNDCELGFTTPSSLVLHRQTHSGDFPYSCDICNKKFRVKQTLISHRSKTHKSKKGKYPCSFCDKIYNTRTGLKMHLRLHTGEKPYVCVICQDSFRTSKQFRNHSYKHDSSKLYSCSQCSKSYSNKSNFADHMHSHDENSPKYTCDVCGKTFVFRPNLAQHKLTHNNKRAHSCDTCGMKFKLAHHLRAHISTHNP